MALPLAKHNKTGAAGRVPLSGRPSSVVLRRWRRDASWLALIFPTLLVLILFFGFPVLSAVYTSTFSYAGASPHFVGLGNFRQLFADAEFHVVVRNTALYTFGVVTVEFLLGFGLAALLSMPLRGARLFRTILLVPLLVPTVVVALSWQWLLVPQYGLVNMLAKAIGIPIQIAWIADPRLSLPTVMMVDVWLWTPLMMMILVGGFMSVPKELIEAARVDGATSWQVFLFITLPWMRNAILLALLIRTVDAIKTFDIVHVLTGGGPGYSSEVMSEYAYKIAFRSFQFGQASAIAIMVTALLLLVGFILMRLLRREFL